jgi:hypothetical protein
MKLELLDVRLRLGKYSNNVLGESISEWTFPFTGIMLDAEQLNALTGDANTWRSWYVTAVGKAPKPCEWWSLGSGEFAIEEAYQAKYLSLAVSGDRLLEWEWEKGEGDKDDVPACKIKSMKLIARIGGLTELQGSLHLRPGRDRENLILQDHQYREVAMTLRDSTVVKPKGKQQELPFCPRPIGGVITQDFIQRGDEAKETRIAVTNVEPEQSAPDRIAESPVTEAKAGGDVEAQSLASAAQGTVDSTSHSEKTLAVEASTSEAPESRATQTISGEYDNPDGETASQVSPERWCPHHDMPLIDVTTGCMDCFRDLKESAAPAARSAVLSSGGAEDHGALAGVADTHTGGAAASLTSAESSPEDSGLAAARIVNTPNDEMDFRKREPSEDYDKPRELVKPDGTVIALRSQREQDEISAATSARHEAMMREQARAVAAAHASDLKDFETRFAKEIKARGLTPSKVINATTAESRKRN